MFLPQSRHCFLRRVWFVSSSKALIGPEFYFCLLIFPCTERFHKELLYGFVCSTSGCLFTFCLDKFYFPIFFPSHTWFLMWAKNKIKLKTLCSWVSVVINVLLVIFKKGQKLLLGLDIIMKQWVQYHHMIFILRLCCCLLLLILVGIRIC